MFVHKSVLRHKELQDVVVMAVKYMHNEKDAVVLLPLFKMPTKNVPN